MKEILVRLYRFRRLRRPVRTLLDRCEGGELYSVTLREIFRRYHQVDIGLYTHGGCFVPGQVDKHTVIGRYSSIARHVRIMNRNHPIDFKSSHAFFFNPELGCCENEVVPYIPLEIGNDVWVGHGAMILPHVKHIADGAVIAAGSVVNKDIPPYAVVVGNPARIVRYRFPNKVIEELLESRWWEKDIEELKSCLHEFNSPYFNETMT